MRRIVLRLGARKKKDYFATRKKRPKVFSRREIKPLEMPSSSKKLRRTTRTFSSGWLMRADEPPHTDG